MGRVPLLLVLTLAVGCTEEAGPAMVERALPAPPITLGDCHAFTAPRMENGREHAGGGVACRQPDGTLRIVEEAPLPDAAIALGTPIAQADEQATTVYYPYDPTAHSSGLFGSRGGYGGTVWWHDGAFRGFGHHRHHFFGGDRLR